jgi:prepilin-type N-terminal cleavage/methylation domain-containing protein
MAMVMGKAKERGFTLLETVIALAMVSILLVALAEGLNNFGKQRQQYARTTPGASETGQTEQLLNRLTESGLISTQFEHLPIATVCSTATSNEPCLRTIGATDVTFSNVTSAITGIPTWIEFFRDDYGRFSTAAPTPPFPAAAPINPIALDRDLSGTPVSVSQRSAAILVPRANTRSTTYATWRLVNPTSPPFVILSRARSKTQLSYVYGAQDTQAVNPDRHTLFSVTDCANVQGELQTWAPTGLFLIYNSEDPSQYLIQRAKSISVNCVSNQATLELVPVIGGSGESDFINSNYAPSLSSMGYTNDSTMVWGNVGDYAVTQTDGGASPLYLFPSTYFNLSRTTPWSAPNPFTGAAADIRRIAWYYKNVKNLAQTGPAGLKPNIVAIPIVVTSLYLAPGILPQGCDASFTAKPGCPTSTFYSLNARTLPGNLSTVLISTLHESTNDPGGNPAHGFVTFYRQLGSPKIGMEVK